MLGIETGGQAALAQGVAGARLIDDERGHAALGQPGRQADEVLQLFGGIKAVDLNEDRRALARLHVSGRAIECRQEGFAARKLHFQELVVLRSTDLADPAVGIDGALGQFLKIVAVLNDDFPAAHRLAVLNIDLGAGRHRPLAVAG